MIMGFDARKIIGYLISAGILMKYVPGWLGL